MNFTLFSFISLVIFFTPVKLEDNSESESTLTNENDPEINKGIELVTNAFKTLINGEELDSSYKDMFIDTSKPIFDHLENGMKMQFKIPSDDMLKILAQTIVILIANRRADLIPLDFSGNESLFLFYLANFSLFYL